MHALSDLTTTRVQLAALTVLVGVHMLVLPTASFFVINVGLVVVWLALALLPLLGNDKEQAVSLARASLDTYQPQYEAAYLDVARSKLGLEGVDQKDALLFADLLELLEGQVDYTRFFRSLWQFGSASGAINIALRGQLI